MGPLDGLSDDALAHVVSFLDFESAVTFSNETYPPLTERFASDSYQHIWRSVYARHYFAPMECSSDYMQECKERRQLVQNLVGTSNKPRNCFNLPNRFFYFVPIMPIMPNDDDMPWEDPPPVDFDCNSFVLTGMGSSGEFIFLDPFDMSLSIHNNCTDNAVASDEAMIRKAMLNAACAVVRRNGQPQEERDEHIAGAIIDEIVYRNHNVQEYRTPPSQVLISAEDYFDVNLAEYFYFTEDRHVRRRTPQGNLLLHPDDEVDFGYIGIEAKPIVGKDGQLVGTLVGLGRLLCSLRVDGAAQDENIACTEVVTWRKLKGESQYGDVRICRVPWDIYCADTCSKNNLMYVVYYRGQGPLPRVPHDDDVMDDADARSAMGRKTVVAYPLMPITDTASSMSPRYFPQPEFQITCSDFVSYVTVDCAGTLLVGTNSGTIEVWKTDMQFGPTRMTILNSKDATVESARRFKAEAEARSAAVDDDLAMDVQDTTMVIQVVSEILAAYTSTTYVPIDADLLSTELGVVDDREDSDVIIADVNDSDEEFREEDPDVGMEQDPVVPAVVDNVEELPRLLGSPAVDSFHFPGHLPIEECGFVSQHHSRVEGTSLFLWKKIGRDVVSCFRVVSQINLPLSPRRKPRIHYDGRRIIVLGEDHIGVIILVYHVYSSTEDVDYFPPSPGKKLGDESGGLYNYTVQPHVRFANRIRHAALGGLERFEGMYMTCNERFLVVNTKTGNLLGGGSSPTGDGLLVVDLKEHE